MKDKTYFTEIFNKKWDACIKEAEIDIQENGGTAEMVTEVATEFFEETANAEEVVGYYVVYHRDSALKDWLTNTAAIHLTEQDKEVDRILKELYH